MHFPFALALKDQTLLLSSQAPDGHYAYGRLMSINTNAVDNLLKTTTDKPLPLEPIRSANTLIAPDIASIHINSHIIFASRDGNFLYAAAYPLCDKPHADIMSCEKSTFLALPKNDPYALEIINDDIILVSYLSSARLDLIKLDKDTSQLTFIKHFSLKDWVLQTEADLITKKISTYDNFIYILAEKHISIETIQKKIVDKNDFKIAVLEQNNGSILIKINKEDLINKKTISPELIIDLQQLFNISSAHDFFIDKDKDRALILAREPESLFMIDLKEKNIVKTESICRQASSLAISLAHDRFFVPCFYDNTIVAYSLSSLSLQAVSSVHGRAPAFIAVDDAHKRIFVSYNHDGIVALFNFNLDYENHLFDQAPINRIGS
jgi:hypothetical protein